MLEKVVQIKSIGRFQNYAANGDVTFRKLTLIYAENGRGKTTLCAILRSLQTGQKEFILERKTLADTNPPFVYLRINDTDYRFTNDAWTATHPDIIIFDPVFVNENVYSGDYVEHEHKKNLYRVIVGAQGVRLAQQIEILDRQIRDANADLRTTKESVSQHIPQGISLDDYLQWQPIGDIEDQIRRKEEELDARHRAAAKAGEIQTKELFVKIQLPSLPTDFSEVLAKQLTDIVADVESKVRGQIARHQMEHQGETWLSQGLGYVRDERCPFCGQGVEASDLLAAYRSYFSEAYRSLKQEVAQLIQRVNSAIGEASLGHAQQAIAANAALVEFWQQFTAVDLPNLSFQDIQQKYAALRERCIALAERKQQGPTEAVTPDDAFTMAIEAVKALQSSVDSYNTAVDAANASVNEQKRIAARAQADLTPLRNELAQLQARKKRFEPEVAQVCQAYQAAVTAKAALEQQKETVRQQLDQHCESIIRTYEQSINEYLDQFNAGFRITNTGHRYTGGTPSSHYQIEINSTALDLGDARTPSGTPCFKTTLSSGDRSALALAFFLAVLKRDADINRKIVVFDDPFTSMDGFRRGWTEQTIRRLLQAAQQVIVCSHEAGFLKGIQTGVPAGDVKALQLRPNGPDNTIITGWDVDLATQSSYEAHYRSLLAYRDANNGTPLEVARAIRPFLEEVYRPRYPDVFCPTDSLGDIVAKARQAVRNGTIQIDDKDLDELDAINEYARKFQHGQSPSISEEELRSWVRRALKLVGRC